MCEASTEERQNFLKEVDVSQTKFEIKLGDLGFAKHYAESKGRMNSVCGTPLFMAPQLINEKVYSNKADVWALGVITYYLLTGGYPFTGFSLKDLRRNLRAGKYSIEVNSATTP